MTPMLGIMASQISGHLTPPSSYESIATYNPTSGQSVTFSSIPSTFKSLQVRILYLTSGADNINYRLNGDTGTNYAVHYLFAAGSETPYANGYTSPFDTKGSLNAVSNIAVASPYPTVLVVDFIDYTSTTKNKIMRSFAGGDNNSGASNSRVGLTSGLWLSTAAVTSLSIITTNYAFMTGTSIALYGIRG